MTEGVDEEKRATLRRFAALGATSPLAALGSDRAAADETEENEVRTAIAGYLASTPGAHFSKLRDDLRLGTGEAQHHLRRLEENGSVESARDGDYRRFYPTGQFTAFEQRALAALRRETPKRMILALLREPELSGAALAERLDVTPATVSSHASDLADAGLLERADGYRVVEPETVLLLVVRYADSFGTEATALAADADDLVRFRA